MTFVVIGNRLLKNNLLGYYPQEEKYVFSYYPRRSVEKIGLWGYVQYESHLELSILVRIFQKVTRPCRGHSQDSVNMDHIRIRTSSTSPSNKA